MPCHCKKDRRSVVDESLVFTKLIIFNSDVTFNADIILGGVIKDRQGRTLVGQMGELETPPLTQLPLVVTSPGNYFVIMPGEYDIQTDDVNIFLFRTTPQFRLKTTVNPGVFQPQIIPEVGNPAIAPVAFVSNGAPTATFSDVAPQLSGTVIITVTNLLPVFPTLSQSSK